MTVQHRIDRDHRQPTHGLELADQLRAAIQASGLSCAKLSRMAGIDRRILDRWLSGERDLNLASAGRIAEGLDLRLVGPGGDGTDYRPQQSSIAEQLRWLIIIRGLSGCELARRCGVDHRVINRFIARQRGLHLASAGRIFSELGLKLIGSVGMQSAPFRLTPPPRQRDIPRRRGRPESDPARNELILRLSAEGFRSIDIANRLRLSDSAVRSVLYRRGARNSTPERSEFI